MPTLDHSRLERAYHLALDALLRERTPAGYWVGELSASALSTATAVMALSLVQQRAHRQVEFDALPALIALGQCVHHHRPPWNPLTRCTRWLARKRTLRVLESIQPSNGGFLEATPLTSFVTLSLASIGQGDHPVARKGVQFIVAS